LLHPYVHPLRVQLFCRVAIDKARSPWFFTVGFPDVRAVHALTAFFLLVNPLNLRRLASFELGEY
jgi:hypothetical protein